MKSKRAIAAVLFLILTGCSSGSGSPDDTLIDPALDSTQTTIDPLVAELQQQVEELQTQISATTSTNAPKAAPVFSHQGRYNTGNYKSTFSGGVETKLIQCQVTDFYMDGSFVEYPRTWMKYDDFKAVGC
jgi:hypothetical protein